MTDSVLVTGAAGFIGGHLSTALLDAGHRVTGVDNLDPFDASDRKMAARADLGRRRSFHFVEADVRSREVLETALRNVDAVVHLAARAGVRRSFREPAAYAAINVAGTAALLDACVRAGTRRVVFASSASVYGSTATVPFREDRALGVPQSPYAVTKRAGEDLCATYARSGDLRVAAVRLFSVYGPRARPDLAVSRFTRAAVLDEPAPLFGDGTAVRDLTHVDDAVRGLRAALAWTAASDAARYEPFNVSGGQPIAVRDLLARIEAAAGRAGAVHTAAPHAGDMLRTAADLTKAGRILDYAPRVTLDAGIPGFVHWYEASHGRERRPTA